jgi:hypothetical protein
MGDYGQAYSFVVLQKCPRIEEVSILLQRLKSARHPLLERAIAYLETFMSTPRAINFLSDLVICLVEVDQNLAAEKYNYSLKILLKRLKRLHLPHFNTLLRIDRNWLWRKRLLVTTQLMIC